MTFYFFQAQASSNHAIGCYSGLKSPYLIILSLTEVIKAFQSSFDVCNKEMLVDTWTAPLWS